MQLQLKGVTQSALPVVLALVLAACSPAPERPAAEPPAAAVPQEGEGDFAEPGSPATWDAASSEAAAQAATAVMAVFVSHPGDATAWWSQLQPLLSPTAARDYAGVDPANVPARRLSGPVVVEQDASAYLATVLVPTDRGAYTVLLSRQGGDQPWLAERLTPPSSASDGARS